MISNNVNINNNYAAVAAVTVMKLKLKSATEKKKINKSALINSFTNQSH